MRVISVETIIEKLKVDVYPITIVKFLLNKRKMAKREAPLFPVRNRLLNLKRISRRVSYSFIPLID